MPHPLGRIFCFGLAIACNCLHADVLTVNGYRYEGGTPDFPGTQRVYSAWNPRNDQELLAPGLKVLFFGEGTGCDRTAANGPTAAHGNPYVQRSHELTGIDYTPELGMTWTPVGDLAACDPAAHRMAGDAFVHLNPAAANGGVALFTTNGRDATGRTPFLQPFPATGRNGTGNNAFITGTFVAFRFGTGTAFGILPWQRSANGLEPLLEIRSTQSVARVLLPAADSQASETSAQAKQQLAFTLLNRHCLHTLGGPGRLCQIQYLLNIAVYRSGIEDWDAVDWFRDAAVRADPAQGGMPVVHGPIPASGETAHEARTGYALYSSAGTPTQHAPFSGRTFTVRITFPQLLHAVRAATAARLDKVATDITDTDLRTEFGAHWDDPAEWSLLAVNVGQEVYNRTREQASIGGNFQTLSLSGRD
ncbi:MAG: hypothetical protein R3F42_02360 [Pseudomonadota bacterium]